LGVFKKMKSIYHDKNLNNYFLFRGLANCIRKVRGVSKHFNGFRNLLKLKVKKNHNKNSSKITIVFLYQMPEIWNKLDSVCKECIKNDKFNVIILAIPKEDMRIIDGVAQLNFLDNDAFKDASDMNCTVIDARINENEWFDLKKINPDYVFYQRPYDHYLPEMYRSYNTIKYTKTCYVPYGWIITTNLLESCLNGDFFINLYFTFANNMENVKFVRNNYAINHALNLRKTLCLGYPSLEDAFKFKASPSVSWERDRDIDKLRIIWTPRWTTDVNLCSSNFFEYKDKFVEFTKKEEDLYFLFRPHPLAFDNYLKMGLMSKIEIDEYKNSVEVLENASIDAQKEYLATFWNSDVLITDMSSIIVEYFLTGKPIIYCDNGTSPLDEFANKMSKGFYWAKDWNEIEAIIVELKNGKDVLFSKRKELIDELFGNSIAGTSSRIVESILKDYMA